MTLRYLHYNYNNYKLLTTFQRVHVYLYESVKVDELIKVTNQLVQSCTCYRNDKNNNKPCFSKQKVVCSKNQKHESGQKHISKLKMRRFREQRSLSSLL